MYDLDTRNINLKVILRGWRALVSTIGNSSSNNFNDVLWSM